ncbi:cysteine proteinase [Backusella circina FSU 941]|nr:cysteine proteinase [Backusella circina FSU 941]
MSSERTEKAIKGKGSTLVSKNNLNQLLNRAIKFRKSRYVDHKLETFKQRFAPVNSTTGVVHQSSAYITEEVVSGDKVDKNGFEQPAKVLFSKEKLSSGWKGIYPVGSGLKDLGQLSSLNAVLQICTFTPGLANYFMEKRHSPSCTAQDYCFVCALEEHVRTALKGSTYALQPRLFAGKLKKMKNGTTKDAYDIWTFFTAQIQSFLLSEKGSKDARVQETTALYQIFGGYLQNHLTCPHCNETENVYQSFLDVSLNIAQCSSVERALTKHFNEHGSVSRECTGCQKQDVYKGKKSIYKSPMSLVLQLQRFDQQGKKNNKIIKFEEKLDIKRTITPNETQPTTYQLYAVIVHTGDTINAGHYTAYVKSSNGIWYCMDNDEVQQVSVKRMLGENPYMLFYTVPPPATERTKKTNAKKPVKNTIEQEEEETKAIPEEESDNDDDDIPLSSDNDDEQEEEKKLQLAMEEASNKTKVDNSAAIVVQHNDNMKSKRDKLGALIEKEMAVSKSGKAKEDLLSNVPDNQFQNDIGTWNEDGAAVAGRKKIIKQLKHKRKKVDMYDLDYDRGKVKKVKNKQDDKFGKPNMFQIASDMKKTPKKK